MMALSVGSIVGLALVVVVSGEFTCPDYGKIRTSGVAPANFKIEDVSVKDPQPFLPSSVPARSCRCLNPTMCAYVAGTVVSSCDHRADNTVLLVQCHGLLDLHNGVPVRPHAVGALCTKMKGTPRHVVKYNRVL